MLRLRDGDFSCRKTSDCTANITNTICSDRVCDCSPNYPIFVDSVSKCLADVKLNLTCAYDEQCTSNYGTCDSISKLCVCEEKYEMKKYPDFGINCVGKSGTGSGRAVDPGVIGAVVGLGLMFVIMCGLLRLFSKERFRENRSIFNTPNPRLMNASLFRESKLLSPAARGERRGSRASVRGPSRAPSLASVTKEGSGRSPSGSLAKGRRGSALSNISATGSASGTPAATAKASSPSRSTKDTHDTTVAIEAVD